MMWDYRSIAGNFLYYRNSNTSKCKLHDITYSIICQSQCIVTLSLFFFYIIKMVCCICSVSLSSSCFNRRDNGDGWACNFSIHYGLLKLGWFFSYSEQGWVDRTGVCSERVTLAVIWFTIASLPPV